MNWLEILRLIVQIWPLIERILGMIENPDERATTTRNVELAVANLLGGNTTVNTVDEVIDALVAPLPIA